MKRNIALFALLFVIALIILGFISVATSAQPISSQEESSCAPVLLTAKHDFVLKPQTAFIEFKDDFFIATFTGEKSPVGVRSVHIQYDRRCGKPIIAHLEVKDGNREIRIRMTGKNEVAMLKVALKKSDIISASPRRQLEAGEYIVSVNGYNYPFNIKK